MKKRILLCEDEENIVSFLEAELSHEGYDVETANDGDKGLALAMTNVYDLLLLDLMLPFKSGLEILREVRKKSSVPVIMISARKDVTDKVALIGAGADDYVTKPFDTLELLARVKRNISRGDKSAVFQIRELFLDEKAYVARLGRNDLKLTKTEFEILRLLMKKAGEVLSRESIIGKVYGSFYGDSNVVDVNIRNIRSKMGQFTDEEYIVTVRGKGYVIRVGYDV